MTQSSERNGKVSSPSPRFLWLSGCLAPAAFVPLFTLFSGQLAFFPSRVVFWYDCMRRRRRRFGPAPRKLTRGETSFCNVRSLIWQKGATPFLSPNLWSGELRKKQREGKEQGCTTDKLVSSSETRTTSFSFFGVRNAFYYFSNSFKASALRRRISGILSSEEVKASS